MEQKIDVLRLRRFKYESFIAQANNTDAPAKPTLFADCKADGSAIKLRQTILGSMMKTGTVNVSSFSLQVDLSADELADGTSPSMDESKVHSAATTADTSILHRTKDAIGQFIGLYDYHGVPEQDELPFHAGDVLVITEQDPSGWWRAKNSKGDEGFIPHNYVEQIKDAVTSC